MTSKGGFQNALYNYQENSSMVRNTFI